MEFTDFSLHENLLKGIAAAGYVTCTPVQQQVISTSLSGEDLYVQSQTGTGKTAAYLITIIEQMLTREKTKGKKALIMVPTRELAVQVEQEAKVFCDECGLKTASFFGGVGYTQQTKALKDSLDIIVGTPGRVIDLQESGAMDLSDVAFLVIDEADRMFDMGFYPDLRKLIKVLPPCEERQTMLFSATLNSYVKNLAWEYTRDAKEITIESETVTVEEIDQILLHVSSDCKMKLLLGILKNENPESVIIFCNTKRSCEVVAKRLQLNSLKAEFIIGDLPQSKRLEVLNNFKDGKLKILVATDVAARGIDVNDLSMVINYDLPNESENYVHRIGRTARAGKSGKAYTFCSEQDVYNLPAIERYIDMQIPSSMAGEDMMSPDASEGKYIKCDDYGYEQEDKRKGRRTGKEDRYSSKKDGKDRRHEKSSRSFSKKSDKKEKDYKNKRSTFNEEELANLSFEERMKMYKEKYGKKAEQKKEGKDLSKKVPSLKKTQTKKQDKKPLQSEKPNKKNTEAAKAEKITGLSSLSFWERLKLHFKK